jgi:hypothetical protein
MTLGYALLWIIGTIVLVWMGSKGGVLLLLSRAIDNMRAAIRCAELAWDAAKGEWLRNWESCQHWARRER